jgi:FkbM family methyltransferase
MPNIPYWRRVSEHLSRGVVLRRRLPLAFGRSNIYVTPEAGLKYWRLNLAKSDPLLFQMAEELIREGDVVWDIGANVGLFSFAAAALAGTAGQVIAVEPDLWLCHLLSLSSSMSQKRRAPVSVVPAAVSDHLGLARLQIATRSRSANYLEGVDSQVAGGARTTQWTPVFTLDSLLGKLPPPNVVKIDVEGMEHRALRGAKELLLSFRPRIWCEVWSRNQPEVTQLLQDAGYSLYPASVPKSQRQPLSQACWDTLALPLTTPV